MDLDEQGFFPTFNTLHLPVGGSRFRPGIEDVLQMAVSEFGIDAQDNWKRYLEDSRADYRESQVKAMVAEHPELAVTALSELGYEIDGSNTKQLKQRPFDSLRVY